MSFGVSTCRTFMTYETDYWVNIDFDQVVNV